MGNAATFHGCCVGFCYMLQLVGDHLLLRPWHGLRSPSWLRRRLLLLQRDITHVSAGSCWSQTDQGKLVTFGMTERRNPVQTGSGYCTCLLVRPSLQPSANQDVWVKGHAAAFVRYTLACSEPQHYACKPPGAGAEMPHMCTRSCSQRIPLQPCMQPSAAPAEPLHQRSSC